MYLTFVCVAQAPVIATSPLPASSATEVTTIQLPLFQFSPAETQSARRTLRRYASEVTESYRSLTRIASEASDACVHEELESVSTILMQLLDGCTTRLEERPALHGQFMQGLARAITRVQGFPGAEISHWSLCSGFGMSSLL